MEQLTPIDEEPSEDDGNDEDQPITMIPKIMHTAPSPTTDFPPNSNVTSTTTVNNEQHQHNQSTPKHTDSSAKLIDTSTTVTAPTSIPEITIENETEKQSIQHQADTNPVAAAAAATDTTNGGKDSEVSQIESVL